MQSSTQTKLSGTFLEVVEQLTFMFGEEVPKSELEVDGMDFMLASMDFSGDMNGTLSVAVPDEVTMEIAANVLGLEPEDVQAEDMRRDALAEMLNVVCGHVIMAMVGTDANFKLDSPVTGSIDTDKVNSLMLDEQVIGLTLDDSPVFLGLSLEN